VRNSRGFTLVELLIVIAIVGVLASFGMALYRQSRIRGNEAVTVAALTAINHAQFAFAQACGNQRYAPTLADLATPMAATGSAFISPDLALDPVVKSGYSIAIATEPPPDALQSCNGIATVSAYRMTADPVVPGYSGVRYFGTNTDRVIFQDTATFTGNMPETGDPSHGTEVK
jgi:type IV pilus assembly protein PilA